MNVENIRLLQNPDRSFIFFIESNPFAPLHNHPEYELSLITKGKGRRMIGDQIDRFEVGDVILIGPYTPHEWVLDQQYNSSNEAFKVEMICIQFLWDFLGEKFFEVPENARLKEFMLGSLRGYEFKGRTKKVVKSIMLRMIKMNNFDRLQALFSIFRIFTISNEFNILASPAVLKPGYVKENGPMQKAVEFILHEFHRQIHIDDMLKITNMSATSFRKSFKNSYRMTFKDYLLAVRIGSACKLITEESTSISTVAFKAGFENISNFNRQFKKIKGITPSQFQKRIQTMGNNSY